MARTIEAEGIPEKPGLRGLLQALRQRGVPMAVASSSHEWEVRRNLDRADIAGYFDVIVHGDEVSRSKPDPEIYALACARLGLAPGDCVALEDSRNGLLSAHAAGCRAMMVPDLWQPDETVLGWIEGPMADLEQVREQLLAELAMQGR